jgi:hypothetical protein
MKSSGEYPNVVSILKMDASENKVKAFVCETRKATDWDKKSGRVVKSYTNEKTGVVNETVTQTFNIEFANVGSTASDARSLKPGNKISVPIGAWSFTGAEQYTTKEGELKNTFPYITIWSWTHHEFKKNNSSVQNEQPHEKVDDDIPEGLDY